ncbi:GUN4 domain-containing protein [Anabaenopsis sp. FSS-46]|uniref:GUN4 domain-containing protein n=1 Tax=Anabaenopsis sp. FSS-46 TaxID=2971766 RepID=UPI0024755340|nr:GUN4 domain-containing protein [Anabaenopsis sp. FSS-46]MDH6099944.1 GUN4 domain-containing protein [Anabaenopsis sp. FSS-46]
MEQKEKFDVFFCHNSKDKPEVIKVAEQLQQQGVKPWLDQWHLRPGFPWQRELEKQIEQIASAAVFVGKSGFGPWQSQEIDAFLRKFVNIGCPVIPVLLPEAPEEPKLPLFLEGLMWVDFRSQSPEPMEQLIWGITGKRKRSSTKPIIQAPTTPPPLDNLASERSIDYTRLRELLAAKNWKQADAETYRVMIKAVGKEERECFRSDEMLYFPCTDLRTINQLWVKYSEGQFGFSVQKEIYLDVVGGEADGRPPTTEQWQEFGDQVGWVRRNQWIGYNDVTFDKYRSPKGHLPAMGELGYWGWWRGHDVRVRGEMVFSSFARAISLCMR